MKLWQKSWKNQDFNQKKKLLKFWDFVENLSIKSDELPLPSSDLENFQSKFPWREVPW
jgi:hypothetical protein